MISALENADLESLYAGVGAMPSNFPCTGYNTVEKLRAFGPREHAHNNIGGTTGEIGTMIITS
jgi:hypothetical protein